MYRACGVITVLCTVLEFTCGAWSGPLTAFVLTRRRGRSAVRVTLRRSYRPYRPRRGNRTFGSMGDPVRFGRGSAHHRTEINTVHAHHWEQAKGVEGRSWGARDFRSDDGSDHPIGDRISINIMHLHSWSHFLHVRCSGHLPAVTRHLAISLSLSLSLSLLLRCSVSVYLTLSNGRSIPCSIHPSRLVLLLLALRLGYC